MNLFCVNGALEFKGTGAELVEGFKNSHTLELKHTVIFYQHRNPSYPTPLIQIMMYFAPFFLLLFRLLLEMNNLNGKTRHEEDHITWMTELDFIERFSSDWKTGLKIRKEEKKIRKEKRTADPRVVYRGCLEVFYPTFKIKFHFICSPGVKIEKESTMTYI